MAQTLGNTSGSKILNESSKTWSHTVATGDNRILIVCLHQRNLGRITGITYNSVALTKSHQIEFPIGRAGQLWYLIAPATGANNIVVTASSGEWAGFSAIDFSGVNQSSPFNTTGGAFGNKAAGASQTITLTTIDDNAYIVGLGANSANGTGTLSATTGQTTHNFQVVNSSGIGRSYGGYELIASAGAESFGWSSSDGEAILSIGVSLNDYVAPTFVPKMMVF